ncbi:plasmid recombination protein [Variovorax sp. PvP013]|uniref:plasmid recombination protein n=1 Tax=Variovorax sp. PvP013 TaxID=3156435 RepID=UPI003D2445A6
MYCIAQFEKVKDTRKITAMANHNLRLHLSVADKKRIDPARTELNRILENPLGIDPKLSKSMARCFEQHWEANVIQMKSDSVFLIDLVLTTSPEFWGDALHQNGALTPAAKAKLDAWLPVQMDFIRRHFGPDALKFAVLHLDEKTPYIHLMLSPEQTKTLKYRNQYGTQEKTVTSLNANRWNPVFWKKFLTAYAKANEKFNLKRPVEDSMTEKIAPKEYEKLVKFAMSEDYSSTIEKMVDAVLSELNIREYQSRS